ncbi:MAG TPA: DNA polymerase III subunit beta [Dissulfurispiraceae bacterium]|jgi:DNA polymerase-3 subunit beta|nr:DNA polymerase III subunit beta [Dissulfurispiraceae bacterium]
MKATVGREELQRKLSDIQNIVEKKNTMPILSHFLLAASPDGSSITATDLETAFREPIELSVGEGGNLCIPARKLFEIVREMEDDVALESEDGNWLRVQSGKSFFRLACLNADEYPVWPVIDNPEELTLPSSELLDIIERTLYAAGESDTRYVLNGLLFHFRPEGVLCVVGTDGHRLALIEREAGKFSKMTVQGERKLIISRRTAAELRRFLPNDSSAVEMSVGVNHVLFRVKDLSFLARLIEGIYPNYEQVIPQSCDKILTVDRNVLSKSLRRVSVMSRERSNAVRVDIAADSMTMAASHPDMGEAKDEIAVSYGAEPMTIAFNARYILDALNVMSADNVMLRLNDPLSSTILTEEGRDDYRCLIMPMRL